MDSDYRAIRQAGAKRQLRNNLLPRLEHRNNLGGFDHEEEGRPDYPFPFCYEEFDIASLDEEYESEYTACPICSIRVPGDMISHMTLQHGNLVKFHGRRGLRGSPVSNKQQVGRDVGESHMQALLGDSGFRSNSAASCIASTDNLLSSFAFNLSTSEDDDISKSLMSSLEENSVRSVTPQHMWKSSFHSSLSREEREERMRVALGRAVFVQDLLVSTLSADK